MFLRSNSIRQKYSFRSSQDSTHRETKRPSDFPTIAERLRCHRRRSAPMRDSPHRSSYISTPRHRRRRPRYLHRPLSRRQEATTRAHSSYSNSTPSHRHPPWSNRMPSCRFHPNHSATLPLPSSSHQYRHTECSRSMQARELRHTRWSSSVRLRPSHRHRAWSNRSSEYSSRWRMSTAPRHRRPSQVPRQASLFRSHSQDEAPIPLHRYWLPRTRAASRIRRLQFWSTTDSRRHSLYTSIFPHRPPLSRVPHKSSSHPPPYSSPAHRDRDLS